MPNRWRSAGTNAESHLVQRARLGVGYVLAVERDRTAAGTAQAGYRLDQLVLAVAGDAGNAKYLARPDVEVHAVDYLAAAVVLDRQSLDRERGVAGMALAAVDHQLDLAADHQLGEVVLVCLRREPLADHACHAG